jgi:uncharacterized membrane protein
MLLIIVGFVLLALGILVLFRKTEGETELSAFGIKLKSNNSAILLMCLGGIFVLIGQNYSNALGGGSLTHNTEKIIDSPALGSGTRQATQGNNSTTDVSRSISNLVTPGSYPQASDRLLTVYDVNGRSPYELKIMRNEIFARHGYIFKTDDMRTYFNNTSWYRPMYYDVNDKLSDVERQNVDLIKKFEK